MFGVAMAALSLAGIWLFVGENSPLYEWAQGHHALAIIGMVSCPLVAALILF